MDMTTSAHNSSIFHHIKFTTGCVCRSSVGHFNHTSAACSTDNNGFGILSIEFVSISFQKENMSNNYPTMPGNHSVSNVT